MGVWRLGIGARACRGAALRNPANPRWISSQSRAPTMRVQTVLDLSQQTRTLPGSELARTAIWDLEAGYGEATLYENFAAGRNLAKSGDCLGHRPGPNADYVWLSYDQAWDIIHHFGYGLLNLGLKPGQETRIGIYAVNCPEWQLSALGATSQSMVVVPLYDTLGPISIRHIINQTEIPLVLTDSPKRARSLLELAPTIPSLRHIVLMKESSQSDLELDSIVQSGGKDSGHVTQPDQSNQRSEVKVHQFQDIVQSGRGNPGHVTFPKPDDLCLICYTSGTTGQPKGVQLSHKNLMTILAAFLALLRNHGGEELPVFHFPTLISYLPLAHVFQQIFEVFVFSLGGRIGYFYGDVNRLLDDVQALKPSILPAVPRMLNLLDDRLCAAVKQRGLAAQALLKLGVAVKLRQMRRGVYRRDTIWDGLIFGKAQEGIGGNVQFIITASAPVSPTVLNRCRAVLGCLIYEGYGLTESTAGITLSLPNDLTAGHVGPPLPICQLKLIDAPELNYYACENRGEVCIKGPTVTRGYFRDPAATAVAIDADGWLHTGDIGTWLPNGALKIIDRKGNIIKMAQGEFVSPEKVEEAYSHCDLISNIFVVGSPLQSYLVAIVTPKELELSEFAAKLGIKDLNFADLCENLELKKAVLEQLQNVGRQKLLNNLEQIQALHLTSDLWSVDGGHLTPTLKKKRSELQKIYANVIAKLYENKT